MKKLTQCETILKAMIDNKNIKVWSAKDFQYGEYFVGYEATARMSDLINKYPDIFIIGQDGRFRTLEIDWSKEQEIKDIKFMLESKMQE